MIHLPGTSRTRRPPLLIAITGGWWVWLIWLVLHSLPPSRPTGCWVICESSLLPDVVGNIVVFGVATFLLVRAGARGIVAGLAGVAVVLTAEVLQWTVLVGRHPSVLDIVGGSVGSVVGAFLAGARVREVSARARWSALAVAWCGWLGLLGLTSWAFQPVLDDGPFGVVVTPSGREMGIVATPDVSDGSITITGEFTSSLPEGYSTLAVIVGDRGWVAEVAVWWRGLVFGTGINGGRLGLPTRGLHLIRTLPDSGVDGIHFAASRSSGMWALQASRPGWSDRIQARPSPLWGWAFLSPVRYAMGWERHAMTILYALSITIPLGFLTGWVGRASPRPLVLASAVFLGLGLGVIPWMLGAPMSPAWHWLIAVGAFIGGLVVSGWRFLGPNPK
jgi:hypothetical protein